MRRVDTALAQSQYRLLVRADLDLVQRGYQLGEVGYLDLITAQRTYFQTNLAYLDSLAVMWGRWAEIDGLLLSGSLEVESER